MLNYTIISLKDLLDIYNGNESAVKSILNTFDCLNNLDVDKFLKDKALTFDRQSLSRTHLVFTSYKDEMVLVGYYVLAIKHFVVKESILKSNSGKNINSRLRQRINRFAQRDSELGNYIISAPLIGQLGKNDNYRNLISGDVLLKYACDKVREIQAAAGGKIVYLECEDKPALIEFYERNGFVNFGRRNLEYDEKDDLSGKYLIQMLKYL